MRGQRGVSIIELLAVIAVLAVLAGVVVFLVGRTGEDSAKVACRSERRIIGSAIEASRVANQRQEYPAAAGPDGLDAVRVDGFLDYEPPVAEYWEYVLPPGGTTTRPRLERVNTAKVPLHDCPD